MTREEIDSAKAELIEAYERAQAEDPTYNENTQEADLHWFKLALMDIVRAEAEVAFVGGCYCGFSRADAGLENPCNSVETRIYLDSIGLGEPKEVKDGECDAAGEGACETRDLLQH